jgi:predicted RNA binding protein YcfA (HicA-like mRNA interferase family)
MSRKEKLFQKIKNNPRDVRFSELRKLLEYYGYYLDHVSGSHHIFFREGGQPISIPVHHNRAKEPYVREAIAILELLRGETEE